MNRRDWTVGKAKPSHPIPDYAKKLIGSRWRGLVTDENKKDAFPDLTIIGWTPYEFQGGKGYEVKFTSSNQKGKHTYFPEHWLSESDVSWVRVEEDARHAWKRWTFFPRFGVRETKFEMFMSYSIWFLTAPSVLFYFLMQ